MKNKLFLATLLIICGMSSSCDKDPEEDVTINNREDNEEAIYDRSENGFFIDGETKLLGYFEEPIIESLIDEMITQNGYSWHIFLNCGKIALFTSKNRFNLGICIWRECINFINKTLIQ